jgi:hypothetical protein
MRSLKNCNDDYSNDYDSDDDDDNNKDDMMW